MVVIIVIVIIISIIILIKAIKIEAKKSSEKCHQWGSLDDGATFTDIKAEE